MSQFLRSPFILWLLWAAMLGTFLVVRPKPGSWLFWGLALGTLLLGVAQMWRTRVEDQKNRSAFKEWSRRLSTLGVTIDVEDDGHLYEWLDPRDWDDVLMAIEGMPAGARSLRAGLAATHPEVLSPDA